MIEIRLNPVDPIPWGKIKNNQVHLIFRLERDIANQIDIDLQLQWLLEYGALLGSKVSIEIISIEDSKYIQ